MEKFEFLQRFILLCELRHGRILSPQLAQATQCFEHVSEVKEQFPSIKPVIHDSICGDNNSTHDRWCSFRGLVEAPGRFYSSESISSSTRLSRQRAAAQPDAASLRRVQVDAKCECVHEPYFQRFLPMLEASRRSWFAPV
jgi:hypothetical protein